MTIPGIEQRCARCGVPFRFLATASRLAVINAHQARCAIAGDDIRWYPDGSDDAGNLINDGRFLDGVVIDNGRTFLRVTAIAGNFGMKRPFIGSVIDWSVSPGTIRRIPRDEECLRTDGYDNSLEVWGVGDIDLDAAAQKLKESGFGRVWLHQHLGRTCCKCPVR